MKKLLTVFIAFILITVSAFAIAGCNTPEGNSPVSDGDNTPQEDFIDYSKQENWICFGKEVRSAVDVFWVCPTVDTKSEYNTPYDNAKVRSNFLGAFNMQRGIYDNGTNIYAPFYRQASMKVYSLTADEMETYVALAYKDVSAAFKYYIENENKGNSIILAGFSQGADMCYRLLKEYFGDEDLYNRLIAAYAIGWACTEDMVSDNPQIKPATGEADTGVVISFDCEAPSVTETIIFPAGTKGYCINPLNWKTDGTVADKTGNPGACFTDYSGNILREENELCGCYIDESRGVLKVTDIDPNDYDSGIALFPTGAYHVYDYQFFYRALQSNVQTRINAFLSK